MVYSSSELSIITTGIGGAGKSSLASEFAARYGSYFAGGVFWLSFADSQNIANEIAACGNQLQLFLAHEDLTLEQRVERVKNEWQKPIPRLLIFDNCDQLSAAQCREFLTEHLPTVGGCRVLITSRNSVWPKDTKLSLLRLEMLTRAESIALLQYYRADLSEDEANEIAEQLGDMPLALTLSGRYLVDVAGESYGQASVYLKNLRAKMLEHDSLKSEEQGQYSVQAAIELSYPRLAPQQDALALELLAHASYFAPSQPIHKRLLHFTTIKGYDPEDEEQGRVLINALKRLLELGLLEQIEQSQVRIHHLIAEFILQINSDSTAQTAIEHTFIAIGNQKDSYDGILVLRGNINHLRHIVNKTYQRKDSNAAHLQSILGDCLYYSNDNEGAHTHYRRAQALYATIDDRLGLANTLYAIGNVLFRRGDNEAGLTHYQQSQALYETIDEPLGLANTLYAIGDVLFRRSNNEGAHTHYRRAQALYATIDDRLGLANTLYAIGNVLQRSHDNEGALKCYQEAQTIFEAIDERLGIANTLYAIGNVLRRSLDSSEPAASHATLVAVVRRVFRRL